jgi:hypothetical protein
MIYWKRESCWPWVPLLLSAQRLAHGYPSDFDGAQPVIDGLFALSFLVAGGALAWTSLRSPSAPDSASIGERPLPLSFGAYVLAGVILPLSTTNIASMGRYVLALFPAFYWFARVTARRSVAEKLLLVCSTFFLALYTLRFMRCAWAG